MPPSALLTLSLQRRLGFAPPLVRRANSLPFFHLLSSPVLRISLTYAVWDVISFVGLIILFLLISFEIFSLCVPSQIVLVLFWESSHFFPFAGCKDGGCWSVLGPFSRASRSKSMAHFSHHQVPSNPKEGRGGSPPTGGLVLVDQY
jgi:hypothetical protein